MALRCSRTARSALDQSGLARVWQPRRRLFRSAVKQAAARAGRTRRWRLSVLRGGFNARRASSSPEPRSGSLSGARPTFSRGFEHVGRVSSRSREPRSRSRLRCLRRDDEREIAYMESELLASEAQVGNRVSWRPWPRCEVAAPPCRLHRRGLRFDGRLAEHADDPTFDLLRDLIPAVRGHHQVRTIGKLDVVRLRIRLLVLVELFLGE